MTSEISSNPIGKLLDLGFVAQGADPLVAAGSTDLGTFGAVLRKLDLSGEATGELADDSDAAGQTMALTGNILPVAGVIDLPVGNFLPSGGETPIAGEPGPGGERAALRAPGIDVHPILPDALLAQFHPVGFPVPQAIQTAGQSAIVPLAEVSAAGIDSPALDEALRSPTTLNAAAATADLPGVHAEPQSAPEAVPLQQSPAGQSARAMPAEPAQTGLDSDQSGQARQDAQFASRERAPALTEASLKQISAQLPLGSRADEAPGQSLQPADAPIRTHLPAPHFGHSGGEFAPPGTSGALEGPAAPHLAEALEHLVERLTDARDRGREARGEVVLRHTDFGAIRGQIAERAEGLQVALTSRDPEFAPSAQAALGERASQGQFQQHAWSDGNSAQSQAKSQGSQDSPHADAAAPRGRDLDRERTGYGQKNGLFA